jgi:penicillin amidase
MRLFFLFLSLLVTTSLIVALDIQLPVNGSKTPRLGMFLSPQKGFWKSAESVNMNFTETLSLKGLKGKADVVMDDRLVPHIYADNEQDLYFIQGYLHAKFRLWQMEFQTHAAGGRLSEILGEKSGGTDFLSIDRMFRRLGMVYAAENTVKAIEADPITKTACDAYTSGVNAYIDALKPEDYPIEYKMLNYKPERWTVLKSALLVKYMAWDLAGFEEDFEMTNARNLFTKEQFEKLFPYGQDTLDPIVPKGTVFEKAQQIVRAPSNVDSLYFNFKKSKSSYGSDTMPDKDNGSNNWAVHGSKTASGRPILCNDPHLNLNLPSLWYELQISGPNFSAYGVSFPGAPSVVIGFNNDCAWGFTNAMRDVRDYYEVKFRDTTQQEYWYDSAWVKTTFRNEVIKIKGQPDKVERIAITVWGPVMYDNNYGDRQPKGTAYACRWKAHDQSNDLKIFIELDKAKNFSDYTKAIENLRCPGQNVVFASKSGDIAIRQQGEFPAKWKRQGDFLMPGDDSSYAWQGMIPDEENITMLNPPRGFVSSANQLPYDTSYPYYLGGEYPPYRGYIINRKLNSMSGITAVDMQTLQSDNYNVFAEMARPVLLKYIDRSKLSSDELNFLGITEKWNLRNDANEEGASVFTAWFDSLETVIYTDDFSKDAELPWPHESTLLESFIKDSSAYIFIDNITTTEQETINDAVTIAFKNAVVQLKKSQSNGKLAWGKFKDSGVRHLLKLEPFSRMHLNASGGNHIINAFKRWHGPSWKMVIHLTDETEAYGIYPGGQSGNPGSKYYDDYINNYVAAKYNRLWNLSKDEILKMKNLGTIHFEKAAS